MGRGEGKGKITLIEAGDFSRSSGKLKDKESNQGNWLTADEANGRRESIK